MTRDQGTGSTGRLYFKISPYLKELHRTDSINEELSLLPDSVRGGHLPGQVSV